MTEQVPKSLLLINQRPFIFYQLELLQSWKIARVVLCVGYLGEMIQETVGNGADFGLSMEYSFDGPELLGTAGALKRALPALSQNFLVMYGDSYLLCDYRIFSLFMKKPANPHS